MNNSSNTTGKLLYGILFCLAIPSLLVVWTIYLDRNLEGINFVLPEKSLLVLRIAGSIFITVGSALLSGGMLGIVQKGKGLPMNAFPPANYVSTGTFSIARHPIYTGFAVLSFGVACLSQSAVAIYYIAPIVIAGCFALIYGYERDAIEKRFGKQHHQTIIGLFGGPDRQLTLPEKIGGAITAFLPWIVIYEMDVIAGPSANWFTTRSVFDEYTPIIPESAFAYTLTYIYVGIVPFTIRLATLMRTFVLDALVAILLAGFIFLVFPFYYEGKIVAENNLATEIIHFERSIDGTSGAFPSFHVIWALIAGIHLQGPRKILNTISWFVAISICLSCILTGIHSVLDLITGAAIVVIARNRNNIWKSLNNISECIANSWREWRIGSFRIINHSIYAGLAASAGILIVAQFIPQLTLIIIIGCTSMIGAAVWGQFVEGSPKILRPFGYFGSILGGTIGVLIGLHFTTMDIIQITAPLALAAPFVQAIGRLRCLVQGCCHGRETNEVAGIHVHHSSSRICAGRSAHKNLHNTQLYSIICNVIIAGILWRLYYANVPATVIAGMYFVLTGLGRFVEENYRGEVQTKVIYGLRTYQWVSIVFVIAGAVITCTPSSSAPMFIARMDGPVIVTALSAGLVYAFAMGMDFPGSKRRFARLTG